jgi:omega-6 fatty acid desaturase (delta-12 desaturase)
VAWALAIAPAAGRLFMRAHDAAHGSLTSSPALNQVLGRIAFLPTFHPMSHWALLHNRRHHVFTNLRSRDVVWAPLSPREYADLPPWRQARYRLYRTTAGFGLYHLVELWWKHFLFPRRAAIGTRTAVNLFDQLLVGAFFAGLTLAAGTTADWRPVPWLESLALVVALPLALFCSIAGFVSYFHHTHPDIPWFDDPATWRRDSDQLGTSLQLSFSPLVGRILGDVMEHPAHHLEPRISLARLREAQAHLSELVGEAGVSQRWTWRAHRQIVAACKLYDFERGCWCDFSGRATAGR